MLNSYSYHGGNYTTNINAVTGAILKNHPKSWFERFHLDSQRAKSLLVEGGYEFNKWSNPYEAEKYKGIIVLQMVICGDMEVLAECVYANDYNSFVKEVN